MIESTSATKMTETKVSAVGKSCPNCGSDSLEAFYSQENVPSHSCLLMSTREQAVNFPVGTITLDCCHDCGFIANTSYDPNLQAYSSEYEETQHFSDCFNSFAKRLAQRWVDNYDLRNKQVLEVGCGKGQFLELLCKLGNNLGIGIDPAVAPERFSNESISRMRFIAEYYSDKHRMLHADAYCCRHTLEHICQTDAFVNVLRRTIADREGVHVFFELPDVTRVLRECAFWDIYYEHCSYFTAGSLARVFRRNRFDVVETYRDYDDQYLILVAQPAATATAPALEIEDDLSETLRDVARFRDQHKQRMEDWRVLVRRLHQQGRRPVIWGAGSKAVAFCTTLGIGDEIRYGVDINPYKQGKYLPGTGHEVVSPAALQDYQPQSVLVMNPIYCDEIQQTLNELNIPAELIPVQ